jgi:hypothetical protein
LFLLLFNLWSYFFLLLIDFIVVFFFLFVFYRKWREMRVGKFCRSEW